MCIQLWLTVPLLCTTMLANPIVRSPGERRTHASRREGGLNAYGGGSFVRDPEIVALAVASSDQRFPVRRIYCVGRNYVEHIREMKEADERDPPFFFQKPADAIMPDGATVPYPPRTSDFHHEVELVVAIGRGGRDISVDSALNHVFGYAIGIDMTRRDRQRESREKGLPWEIGKSFDHSA